jgi:hypothetical protein
LTKGRKDDDFFFSEEEEEEVKARGQFISWIAVEVVF